jgi:2'-5' RNA ligase
VRETKDIRLFFALWPDDDLRKRLRDAADGIPIEGAGRRVPQDNLHLTLHFIGNIYFEEMVCLQRQARRVRADNFSFDIDCRGSFNKPRVAWLGCRDAPAALGELQAQLGRQLQLCAYRPEARRYHPHVTVARKIAPLTDNAPFEPISWKVTEFALVEVQQLDKGVQYRVVETYPLQ